MRSAVSALRWMAVRSALSSSRGSDAAVILAPESLKKPLADRQRDVTTYVDEFARNSWESLLTDAVEIQKTISLQLASLWKSEEERRTWRATEPWLVHKITFRVLGLRAITDRLTGQSQEPARVPLAWLYRWVDGIFEKRERDHIWRRMSETSLARPNTASPAPADVLLFSGSLYAPRVIVPLARKMQKAGLATAVLATASTRPWPFDTGLRSEDLSWNYFLSHVSRSELNNHIQNARARGRTLAKQAAAMNFQPSLTPEWAALVLQELQNILQWDWPMAVVYDLAFSRYLDKNPARLIIQTKNLRVIEGVVTENAASRQIPIVFLDTAILSMDVDHIRFPEPYHAVMAGPKAEAVFQRLGATQDRLHPFGDLRFDRLSEAKQTAATDFLKTSGRIPVLAVGETIGEATAESELKAYYEALVLLQKQYPELDILLKIHPKQTKDDFLRQQRAWKLESLRWVRDANTYDLIKHSQFLLTHMSQAGVEALFLGKPVFIYLEGTSPEKLSALERINMSLNPKYAYISSTPAELISRVGLYLKDPAFAEEASRKASLFRSDYYFNSEKLATDRVVELAKTLVTQEAVPVA